MSVANRQHQHDQQNDHHHQHDHYEYGVNSRAAFVECHPSFLPTPAECKSLLEAVPLVTKVEWQWDVGNLLVYSSAGPASDSPPIEFELTRHQHFPARRATATVTIMFKDPPEGLLGEAWRILLAVTEGKQLLPAHALQYGKKYLAHVGGR